MLSAANPVEHPGLWQVTDIMMDEDVALLGTSLRSE